MTLDDVANAALALPEVVEADRRGTRIWQVVGKTFAWERPFSQADIKRFADSPVPDGVILGVRVADLGEKEAVLGANRSGVFTIPHFDGFAAILIQLDKATKKAVREALVDGWLACAPPKLADQHAARLR